MISAPGPRGLPISGSMIAFQRDPLALLERSVRKHGDVVRFRFAHIIAHLLNHPDHIDRVLSRNAANYDKNTRSAAMIAETCGDSLLSANTDAWARHRKLLQPVFQPRAVESFAPMIDAQISPMLAKWEKLAQAGEPLDIVAEMMSVVISTAVRLLFSNRMNSDRIEAALRVLLADTWRRLQTPLDASMISPFFHRRDYMAARADIDAIIADMIRHRRQSDDRPDDVLTRLLSAHEAEGAEGLSDTELRDAAVTLLLAGHETTANALAWMFWLVARDPQLGLDSVDPQWLFAEALRLYPSIWIIERRAIGDDQVAGFRIDAGTTVLVSPWLLHRNPTFWPDPLRFDPARFAPDQVAARPRLAYLPFGHGPHRCIGLHLARLIAGRIIRQVYAQFRLEAMDPSPQPVSPRITLQPAGPIWLRVLPR
ncbi:MAG: cytochrome P450 [Paracoccus denitrificans]|uniref:Cytochrome P450 n=1 Tax=Paracoccus denitrificans TaxID=266 RepID=A0A533I020_PARDE|nr:MAG: cytochrome P450 [Paracoccus denitrificans]